MTPVRFIRYAVFGGITQREFAALIKRRPATVSSWENGATDIKLNDVRHIRKVALARRLRWKNEILFMTPEALEKRGRKYLNS